MGAPAPKKILQEKLLNAEIFLQKSPNDECLNNQVAWL